MIYPNKVLESLVGMKVGDAKEKYKKMLEDGTPNISVDVKWDENDKNKLIVTATIKYPTKP
jgi:hypothetical protein